MRITPEHDHTTNTGYYLATQRLANGRLAIAEGHTRYAAAIECARLAGMSDDATRNTIRQIGRELMKEQAL